MTASRKADTEGDGAGGVLIQTSRGVATLTLDRPDRLNAFDRHLRLRLLAALRDVEIDPDARAIVITGSGRAFSSGSDIGTFAGNASGDVLRYEYHPIVSSIRAMPKPVIAAVHGVAAGAGVSIALTCDLVVMGRSSRFELSFIKLGLVPDAGLTTRLVNAVGRTRAMELVWQGGAIGATDALAFGLANRVVPDDEVLAESRQLAAELAEGPLDAIAATKRLIEEAESADPALMLEREATEQERLRGGTEHAELLAAWLAKRPRRT